MPRRNRPDLFGSREKAVYPVPPPVHPCVALPRLLPVRLRGDDRLRPAPRHFLRRPVRVEGPVPDQRPERGIPGKVRHPRKAVRLARQDHGPRKEPQRVRDSHGSAARSWIAGRSPGRGADLMPSAVEHRRKEVDDRGAFVPLTQKSSDRTVTAASGSAVRELPLPGRKLYRGVSEILHALFLHKVQVHHHGRSATRRTHL